MHTDNGNEDVSTQIIRSRQYVQLVFMMFLPLKPYRKDPGGLTGNDTSGTKLQLTDPTGFCPFKHNYQNKREEVQTNTECIYRN